MDTGIYHLTTRLHFGEWLLLLTNVAVNNY